jgi:hypothetical protein
MNVTNDKELWWASDFRRTDVPGSPVILGYYYYDDTKNITANMITTDATFMERCT